MAWCTQEGDKRLQDAENAVQFQSFTQEEWEDYEFAPPNRVEWFRNLKFGLFVHFGISACGKVDIGWSRQERTLPDPGEGHIPTDIYDGWANEFGLEDFDAKEWVTLAKAAGMQYIIIITKHHDGFHLWDTKYSDYNIMNYKAKKDYIGEVTRACHELDMPVGFYYSQRDWYHEDYEPVVPEDVQVIDKPPFYVYKEGKDFKVTKKHSRYITYMHSAVKELMTNYGKIDFLWWDSAWYKGMYHAEMWRTEEIETMVRKLQPDILINNRGGLPGDYDTPEERIGMFQTHRPWETCMCLSKHWSWSDEPAKPLNELIQKLVRCAVGDGNFLLSMGGKPDGKIGEPEKERLLQMGEWMDQYGQSLYGTRGGPYKPESWGGSTYKKNKIYIHVLDNTPCIDLPILPTDLIKVECLTDEVIEVEYLKDSIKINIGNRKLEVIDTIIQISLKEDDML